MFAFDDKVVIFRCIFASGNEEFTRQYIKYNPAQILFACALDLGIIFNASNKLYESRALYLC